MARFLFTLAFLVSTEFADAQTLSGAVRDVANRPAPYAVVKLLRLADSTLVRGSVANQDGRYTFTNVPPGNYRVQASLVGLKSAVSAVVQVAGDQPVRVSPIQLGEAVQTLAGVEVRARQLPVDQQVDKTVLNVAADAAAQGKTAYELLQQAPGVVIDPNDNIRMAGKQGAVVLLDGRPTNLSAADLANLLRATSAATIDKVELMTNPSARYDAQGGAGIINIRFRRNKSLGINGSASGWYGQSNHHRANAALDLNYRAKRINLFGNASGSDNYQITHVRIDRMAGGFLFRQRGYDSDGTRGLVYKTGIDYSLSSRQTLGLLVSGNTIGNRFGTYTTTEIANRLTNRVDTSVVNRVDNPAQNNRMQAALNYRYTDTTGLELNLDADLTRFANTSPNSLMSNFIAGPVDGPVLFARRNRFDANTDITIVALKADLVKEWKPNRPAGASVKLETGLKHTDVATDNELLAFTGAAAIEQPDLTRTNRFTYREVVRAGYVSLSRSVGKWSVQGGLRAEHTTVTGRSTDLLNRRIDRPDTTYLNLFPTAFVQYGATQNSQISMKYGRRIGRPTYQDLNPFVYPVDPYTSGRGNPYLRPNYTHNMELNYTYKWATTVKFAYSRTTDFSTDVIQQQGVVAYQTVANVGQVDALNVSVSSPYQFTKWWSMYGYAGATWNRFVGQLSPDVSFRERAFAFEGYMQQSFTLSKMWSAQVSGFWNAPTRQAIYRIGGLGALNLSLQKNVLSNRGKLTFSLDDVLNTMRWRWSGTQQSGEGQAGATYAPQFSIDRKWESRRVNIRFSYRFGSREIKAARERETGQDAGRIKVKGNL